MNEQYVTFVGKVCAPRYEGVFTPEVRSVLPIEASSEGWRLKNWAIYGNNKPNHIDEARKNLPIEVSAYGGNATDWEIYGNDNPVVRDDTGVLPMEIGSNGDELIDYTIYGNNNPVTMEDQKKLSMDVSATAGNAKDWEIYGNNDPVVESKTGDLPIEVSATAGNAVDWVIYGNDENGTENVCTAPTAQTKTVGVLSVTTDGQGQYNITISSDTTSNSEVIFDVDEFTIPVSVGQGGNGTFSMFNTPKSSVQLTLYYGTTLIDYWQITSANRTNDSYTGMSGKVCNKIGIKVMSGATAGTATIKPMFTDNGTLPDHYIPYQQGVGERTENLLNVDDIAMVQIDTDAYRCGVTLGKLSAGNYTLSYTKNASAGLYVCLRTGTTYNNYTANSPYTLTVNSGVDEVIVRSAQRETEPWANIGVSDAMLVKGSTAPETFIPFGYQIPLSISQSGQTDKMYYIYIGTDPLTEGETVSKTSTGVDIELFSGDNIIDTTLANKPQVDLTYRSSVLGVGERTENLVPPIRTANGWKQGYRNYMNGDYIPSYTMGEWLYDVYIPINSASFTFWATNISNPSSTFYFFDSDKQYLPNTAKGIINYNNAIISNISPEAAYMQFAFRTRCMSEQEIIDNNYQVMLVKGSTAPQTYIPYGYQIPILVTSGQTTTPYNYYIGNTPLTAGQSISKTSTSTDIALLSGTNTISTTLGNKPEMRVKYESTVLGVGERTENLLDAQAYEVGKAWNTSSNADRATVTLTVKPNTTYTVKVFETVADLVYVGVKESADATTAVASQQTVNGTVTITTTASAYTLAIQLNKTAITLNDCQNCKITLTEGSTAPAEYIPYGYQIPLIVSKQGQPDKTYDIYIGDTPLIQGQSINRTQAQVDIEPYEGKNIIDVAIDNKPQMNMVYNSDVEGVGVPTVNLWHFETVPNTLLSSTGGADTTNAKYSTTGYFKVNAQPFTVSVLSSSSSSRLIRVNCYDSNKRFLSSSDSNTFTQGRGAITIPTPPSTVYCRVSVATTDTEIMLTYGSVAPASYVPYGYYIPLTITSGQTSTPYSLQLGTTPLTSGQSISKASSGTELAFYAGTNTISTSMGNKPVTRVDYESTEIGVGERTENLFDKNTYSKDGYYINYEGDLVQLADYNISDFIPVEPNKSYTLVFGTNTVPNIPSFAIYDNKKNIINSDNYSGNSVITISTPNNAAFIRLSVAIDGRYKCDDTLMLVKGSIAPTTYIPYGYKIPITVSQQGQTDKTYDVYIGTQTLVYGASVNKGGTGVEIELNGGMNTITTGLYNEPKMYIK